MKSLFATAALASTIMVGAALPSHAAVYTQFYDFGAISDSSTGPASPGSGLGTVLPANPKASSTYGTFQNVFQFTTDTGNISADIASSITKNGPAIKNLTLSLYSENQVVAGSGAGGTNNSSPYGGKHGNVEYTFTGSALASMMATGNGSSSDPQQSKIGYMGMAGTYELVVTGNLSSIPSTYGGNLSVNAVPLPNSVALFGTAFIGLGVVGALRRKGKAAAAA